MKRLCGPAPGIEPDLSQERGASVNLKSETISCELRPASRPIWVLRGRVWLYVWLALVSLGTPAAQAEGVCGSRTVPALCHCVENSQGDLIADCSSSGFEEVPNDFPHFTAIINLKNNRIETIRTYTFPDLPKLERIHMDLNDVNYIEPNAFRELTNLRQLHLSYNNLTTIESWTFYELVGLHNLKLEGNGIYHIAGDAFYFMQELEEIDFGGTTLDCDCDIKRLRDWAAESGVELLDLRCSDSSANVVDLPEEEFENCTEVPPLSCLVCDTVSMTSCLEDGVMEECPTNMDSCQLTINVTSGMQSVTSKCRKSSDCVAGLKSNTETCRNKEADQTCVFCCTGNNCTSAIELTGYTYETTLTISFLMNRAFLNSYKDQSSDEYKLLADEVINKMGNVLSEMTIMTLYGPFFSADTENKTHCDLTASGVWPLRDSVNQIRFELYFFLENCIDEDQIGLDIVPGTLQVAVPDFCPPDVTVSEKGEFHWPNTQAGVTAEIVCPFPNIADGMGRRQCVPFMMNTISYPFWEDPDLSSCSVPSDVTESLKDLLKMNVTNESVSGIASELHALTSGALLSVDLEYTSQLLKKMVTADIRMALPSADDVMGTYNNVIGTKITTLTESQQNFGAINRSLQALDLLSGRMLEAPPDGTLTKSRVSLGVLKVTADMTGGVIFHIGASDMNEFHGDEVSLDVNKTDSVIDTTDASLAIPGSVLTYLVQKHPTLQFVAFSDDKMFKAMDIRSDTQLVSGLDAHFDDVISHWTNGTLRTDTKAVNQSNSYIMAATFGGAHMSDLPEPITITFRHKDLSSDHPRCVFWDYQASPSGGDWSPDGCRVVEDGHSEHTVCECDHLTNFALIMDIYGTAANMSDANKKALSIISYVGCSVSLVGLLMTIITYTVFSKLRKDNPAKLLLSLCGALVMVMVLFVVVTQRAVIQNEPACKAMAVLLHYFLLAAWVWMAIEAFNMYLTLIKIFNTYYTRFLLKCSLVGWGLPAVIVAITLGVSTDNYRGQGEICWLAGNAFYGACVAPILLILVCNFVVFGLVIHQIRRHSARSAERSSKNRGVRTQLRGAFAVVILLGLTWIFSIFAIGGAGIAFHYLFAIFNSFQGLFIFIFYCMLKKDVKDTWREKWSEITSTTATSSERGSGKGSSSKYGSSQSKTAPSSSFSSERHGQNHKDDDLRWGIGPVTGSMEYLNDTASGVVKIEQEKEADTETEVETSS